MLCEICGQRKCTDNCSKQIARAKYAIDTPKLNEAIRALEIYGEPVKLISEALKEVREIISRVK